MNQLAFPNPVSLAELQREATLGGAIGLCAKVGGLTDKEVAHATKSDKAQLSRWQSGNEGIMWPKLVLVMDEAGNDAPVMWMNMQRGYDLSSLRRLESETERELRLAKERIAELERDKQVLVSALRGGA